MYVDHTWEANEAHPLVGGEYISLYAEICLRFGGRAEKMLSVIFFNS